MSDVGHASACQPGATLGVNSCGDCRHCGSELALGWQAKACPTNTRVASALLLAVLSLLIASCVQVKPLPVLGEIPQFELTQQTGQPFDSHILDGHIWVADFIYTNCDGPCPMMSHQMRGIQNSTPADVKLVSFTVDPARDTPPVLTAYAAHFKADFSRWYFLTGTPESLNELGMKAFKLNSVDGSMSHSTRFVLIDAQRRIRRFYMTSDDSFPKNLLHDIRQLESERS